MNKRFFFVLGLPRSRTAWLSVLLTGAHSQCSHAGTNGFATFAEYAKDLREREGDCVGDSNPFLAFYVDDLIREFPDAKLIFVHRNAEDARRAFLASSPDAGTAAKLWHDTVAAFEYAATKLPDALQVDYEDLCYYEEVSHLYEFANRGELSVSRFKQLSALRISTTFPKAEVSPEIRREAIPLTIEQHGFDFSSLSVRAYDAGDLPMICRWWSEHEGCPMPQVPLPPLGVVVMDECGPVAALWCWETYGVGTAWIEMPVTRPLLDYAGAATALAFAVLALTKLAGKGYEPEGEFHHFRVCCPPAYARNLKRLGFVESAQRSNLLLVI